MLNALTLPYAQTTDRFNSHLLIFCISISGLMTARFLLHLRDWAHRSSGEADEDVTKLQFSPFEDLKTEDSFGEDPVLRVLREEREILPTLNVLSTRS